jgi:MSHA pilin protein MshC
MSNAFRCDGGFSLIELIAVIVIIGALAVIALPRFNTSGFDRYAFRHELLSALRYAQKTAMASGCAVEVQLDGGADSYRVVLRTSGSATDCGTGGFGAPLQHPAAGGNYTGTAPAGADLQTTGAVRFDGFGQNVSSPMVTSITLAGGPPIQIDSVTGYIRD